MTASSSVGRVKESLGPELNRLALNLFRALLFADTMPPWTLLLLLLAGLMLPRALAALLTPAQKLPRPASSLSLGERSESLT